jgi:RNA polymerase sigma factor, sigma-70 family
MDEEFASKKIQEWYDIHSDEIYRFIVMLTGDQEIAKDLMHDTFLKSYFSLQHYQGKVSVKNWLYRIARSVTIDYQRRARPIAFYLSEWNLLSVVNSNCPQKIVELGEMEVHLYEALKKLKHSYNEVIVLRKLKEMSIQETAEVLDWSEAKVKTTLFRAQLALKKQLEKEGYTHENI